MAKLKRLNRSDRAKHNAKLGDVVREISKNSGIIATKSGKNFVIDDGADAPIVGMKIYGRTDQAKTSGANLFDERLLNGQPRNSYDGSTGLWTVGSGAGAYGSLFQNASGQSSSRDVEKLVKVPSSSSITIKLYDFVDNTTTTTGCLTLSFYGSGGVYISSKSTYDTEITLKTPDEECWLDIKKTVSAGTLQFSKIMIVEGDTIGEYEPYTGLAPSPSPEYPQAMNSVAEGGSVGVHIRGKQLFNPEWIQNHSAGGATVTNNGDGSLTVSGSGALTEEFTKYSTISDAEVRKFLKPGKLHVKFERITSPAFVIKMLADGKSFYTFSNNEEANLMRSPDISSLFEGNKRISMRFYTGHGATGSTIKPGTIRPLLWQDGDETYDEYREPQTAIFSTPNGLLGIPVESGGNVTDENGQMWVADEIDLEKGVYIQRVHKYVLSGEERWKISKIQQGFKEGFTRYDVVTNLPRTLSNDSLWTHFQYKGTSFADGFGAWVNPEANYTTMRIVSNHATVEELKAWLSSKASSENPVIVQYILETPIETPLTEEEIAAYKTLKTHKPTTIVSNDAGAIVELSYYADKKKYIDKKFAEIQALALEK